MLNTSKIRERMFQLGLSDGDLASAMGDSVRTTVKKLNNLTALRLKEAEALADLLRIGDEAFADYFFA